MKTETIDERIERMSRALAEKMIIHQSSPGTHLEIAAGAIREVEKHATDSDNPDYWVKHLVTALQELTLALAALNEKQPSAAAAKYTGHGLDGIQPPGHHLAKT